jgi:hypothetical protein
MLSFDRGLPRGEPHATNAHRNGSAWESILHNPRCRYSATAALAFACLIAGAAQAQVNVTTFHNDNARTGQNTQETILTPANVNSSQFGKLFSLALDGYVYAQPLYLADIPIDGGTHNVVYMATEHDSVYAIDADSGTIYAHANFIPSGGSTINPSVDLAGCPDLIPEIGISGTPVIDANTRTLYVVTKAKTAAGTFVQYLHALDAATLAEKFGGPTLIAATVSGSAAFSAKLQFQRPALLLENGHVIIGWSGHCDAGAWHGWVISYSASTLAQEAVFNASVEGSGGAIWMAGGGIAADGSGNIYFPTGNGSWNGTTDFSQSIVKLGAPSGGHFPLLDYFTPWNQAALTSADDDVASGGLVLLPPLASGEQLLAQMGKFGTLELLNTANLGKYCVNEAGGCSGSNPNAEQELAGLGGIWGSPAYWNGTLYIVPEGSPIRAYSFNAGNSGKLSTSTTSKSAQSFAFAAPTPAISANGTSNGILWVLDGSAYNSTCSSASVCMGLSAYDATNLAKLLYNSSQSANGSPGAAVKYAAPVIVNGKVYIGTQSGLSVYGLLAHVAMLTAPSFSPAAGSILSTQTVSLSDATAGATIYYTTNGSAPTTSSTKYSAPLTLSANTSIQAIAVDAGFTNSLVASAAYSVTAPVGGGGGGGSGTAASVSLASADNINAFASNGSYVQNGGLDGGYAAYSANLLGSSITWAGSTFTLGAAGSSDAVSSKTVTLPAGNYASLKLLGTSFSGAALNQVFVVTYTDGSSSSFTQSLSDWGTPMGFPGESTALTMAYRLEGNGTPGSAPFYLYGYSFALNSAKSVASITLPNNRHVVVLAMTLTPSGAVVTPTAASPTFSPIGGSYSATQTVKLSATTAGAAIYYTTSGATPTTASTRYSVPMAISANTTIQAITVASGYVNSAVTSAAYAISASGSGTGTAVNVSLSSADSIYGVVNNGSMVPGGGLDGGYSSYSATLLGTSVSWSGTSFALGAAGTLNAVSSKTITLPAGNYSSLKLLGTAVNGSQPNQSFVVSYTDGSKSTVTQGVSDWFEPQGYAGESAASTMAYRLSGTGAPSPGPLYLYGYSLALNSAKTVASLTLPANAHVVVLAARLMP